MTQFPVLLYKCPGDWSGNGYTFATRPANDQGEFDAAVSDGWHSTVPEAVEAWKAPQLPPTPAETPEASLPSLDAPPTRAEIEAKCAELGIAVHHKHNDATLLKKIEDALALKEPSGGLDQA